MLSVAQHRTVGIAYAKPVHEQTASRDLFAYLEHLMRNVHAITYIGDYDMRRKLAHGNGKLCVLLQMSVLAVHGNEKLRLEQRMQKRQLVAASVTRYVQFRKALVYDARAVTVYVVYNVIHHALVAGDRVRGKYDRIVIPELDL